MPPPQRDVPEKKKKAIKKKKEKALKTKGGRGVKVFSNLDQPSVLSSYKAAGVLFLRSVGGRVECLVGHQNRRKDGDHSLWVLGGRREPFDQSILSTAMREFFEESGSVYSPNEVRIYRKMFNAAFHRPLMKR